MLLAGLAAMSMAQHGGEKAPSVSADSALGRLYVGNTRFSHGRLSHPDQSSERRLATSKGQAPFAVIVTCSDSRLSPEIAFDQGIGDVFVVRTAGNVVDDIGLGSIEYAVEHLHANLVIVLGHEKCGAVTAAVAGKPTHTHIDSIIDAIKPSVVAGSTQDAAVHNSVASNVRATVARLRNSEPMLKSLVQSGDIKVVGGVYDLESGVVNFLDQTVLFTAAAPEAPAPEAHESHEAPAPKVAHAEAKKVVTPTRVAKSSKARRVAHHRTARKH